MKFGVVIVTYNRIALLKECIDCVLSQTVPFSHICVVDNHSTDGTGAYLDSLSSPALSVYHLEENIGGAGGFSFGLSKLAETDCDWILIIDDDAMIAPDYMEKSQTEIKRTNYLAYSGTVMTAGNIDTSHRRSLKNPCLMSYHPVPESAYENSVFEYDISTFCGLLIKTSLVREIGLPKTEYFIWFDDTEYCLRFHKQSRILNVSGAVLNHKTTPPRSAPMVSWKNFYGFRNSIDIGKTYSTCPFLFIAYIFANHLAHIVLDSIGIVLKNAPAMRRYRRQIYRDVLHDWKKKPAGRDSRYLPGSGPK